MLKLKESMDLKAVCAFFRCRLPDFEISGRRELQTQAPLLTLHLSPKPSPTTTMTRTSTFLEPIGEKDVTATIRESPEWMQQQDCYTKAALSNGYAQDGSGEGERLNQKLRSTESAHGRETTSGTILSTH